MEEIHTTRKHFMQVWPGGYKSYTYDGRGYSEAAIVQKGIDPFAHKDGVCLEIGPGRGFWSKHLVARFEKVLLLDVIPRSHVPGLICKDSPNFEWIEVGDQEYSMSPVDDNSIDYIFSFDVFCHFNINARREYITAINRVLKPGGNAVIMFANWPKMQACGDVKRRHAKKEDYLYVPDGDWYWDDVESTRELIEHAGMKVENIDMFPDANRDSITHFRKC